MNARKSPPRRAARRATLLLLGFALPMLSLREARADSVLSVLSYNLHGLPALIARDNPHDRVAEIGSLATAYDYDVAMFQEDFEYHGVIRRKMEGSVGVPGSGVAFDAPRLAAKILLTPLEVFVPHFSPPYGAGLATFVKSGLALPGDVGRGSYGVCDGWLGGRFDCWANKGYLRVGVRTADGVTVDVYTTHLDAGRGRRTDRVRRRQLAVLASAIEQQSADRPIIVGGDFNLNFDRPGDGEVMVEFRDRLNLRDTGAASELPFWNNYDYIMYRSGRQAQISVEQAGEALEFVAGQQALSDHPALYTRFRISPSADATVDPGECLPAAAVARPPLTLVQ